MKRYVWISSRSGQPSTYMLALEVMFLGPGGSNVVQVSIFRDGPPDVVGVREARLHARLRPDHVLRRGRKHGRDNVGRHERGRPRRAHRRLVGRFGRPRRLSSRRGLGRLGRLGRAPAPAQSVRWLRRASGTGSRRWTFSVGTFFPWWWQEGRRGFGSRFLWNWVLWFHLDFRKRIPSWRIVSGRKLVLGLRKLLHHSRVLWCGDLNWIELNLQFNCLSSDRLNLLELSSCWTIEDTQNEARPDCQHRRMPGTIKLQGFKSAACRPAMRDTKGKRLEMKSFAHGGFGSVGGREWSTSNRFFRQLQRPLCQVEYHAFQPNYYFQPTSAGGLSGHPQCNCGIGAPLRMLLLFLEWQLQLLFGNPQAPFLLRSFESFNVRVFQTRWALAHKFESISFRTKLLHMGNGCRCWRQQTVHEKNIAIQFDILCWEGSFLDKIQWDHRIKKRKHGENTDINMRETIPFKICYLKGGFYPGH